MSLLICIQVEKVLGYGTNSAVKSNVYLSVGLAHIVGVFITESAPKTHSTAGIEGTQLKSASIIDDVTTKNGT